MTWHERLAPVDQVRIPFDGLSPRERDVLRDCRVWRPSACARMLAKQLLCESQLMVDHWSQIHIESRDGRDRPTRPRAYVNGRLLPCTISLSHTRQVVAASISLALSAELGIDLVDLESVDTSHLRGWLTEDERDRGCSRLAMGMIWSLKEAIYKAINHGTPFYPRQIDTNALLSPAAWNWLERQLRTCGEASCQGCEGWSVAMRMVDATLQTHVYRMASRRALKTPA